MSNKYGTNFKWSDSSKEMLEFLERPLRVALTMALATSPIDFGIVNPTGGRRTQKEQAQLFLAGKSDLNGNIGHESYHQLGWAVDIFAYIDGKAVWEGEDFNKLIVHIIQTCVSYGLNVKWGGLWTTPDNPHLEVVAWESNSDSWINTKRKHN